MYDWLQLIGDSRQNELLNERAREDLIQLALANQDQNDPFYYDVLAALGRQLSALGDQLQDRYGCSDGLECAVEQA